MALRIWTTKLLMTLSWLSLSGVALANNWVLQSEEDGILIYTREEVGSEVISMKGESTLGVSPAEIFEILKDNSIATDWIPQVVAKRDVQSINKNERIEYTHIKMPWPLDDRYYVARARVDYRPGGVYQISVRSVDKPTLIEDDKVLGFIHLSEFVLTPVDGGKRTLMTIEVNTDQRGMVPTWLVNMAQKKWPRHFFRGLIAQLAKRGYLQSPDPALAH